MLGKLKGLLVGGGVEAATKVGNGVANIVERWVPGAEKKHQIDSEQENQAQASTASARAHDAPMQGNSWFDTLVNGINRLVRPGVTIYLLLALDGRLVEIKVDHLDPMVLHWVTIVLTFWFGGRTLVKDLPAAIAYLRRSG